MENNNLGILIMRITSGLFFLAFGVMKFMGLSGFASKYLGVFGVASIFIAFLVSAGEVLAGLALLTGYHMKTGLYILAAIMAGSIFLAHNLFVDQTQMMTALVRVVLIGYYIGLAQIVTNKTITKSFI